MATNYEQLLLEVFGPALTRAREMFGPCAYVRVTMGVGDARYPEFEIGVAEYEPDPMGVGISWDRAFDDVKEVTKYNARTARRPYGQRQRDATRADGTPAIKPLVTKGRKPKEPS